MIRGCACGSVIEPLLFSANDCGSVLCSDNSQVASELLLNDIWSPACRPERNHNSNLSNRQEGHTHEYHGDLVANDGAPLRHYHSDFPVPHTSQPCTVNTTAVACEIEVPFLAAEKPAHPSGAPSPLDVISCRFGALTPAFHSAVVY